MPDVHSKEVRSYNMSRIRGKDTKPEIIVRSFCHRNGLRYRLHQMGLPGKPDLVFKKYKTVVFVHGCFWHRHPHCKFTTTPDNNQEKWLNKFKQNVDRDKQQRKLLEHDGWRVIVVWGCEVKDRTFENWIVQRITALAD